MKGLGGLVVLSCALAWAFSNHSGLTPTPLVLTQQASIGPTALPAKLPQARVRVAKADPLPEPRSPGAPASGWRSLRFAGAPSPSLQWPGYLCTDIDEPIERRSVWYREEDPDATAEIYQGSCAEWSNQGSEEMGSGVG